MIGSYIPLIIFGALLVVGIIVAIVFRIRAHRAEASRWASPK